MKKLVLIAAMSLLSSVAFASHEGIAVHTGDANVRIGTGCSLYMYGQRVAGRCNVARAVGSRNTTVQVGNAYYEIRRYPGDKYSAEFYHGSNYIAEISAQGNCWVGSGVRFCAN